ncbi:dTDP-4-dehydrorhamnose 3,5-epimerase family protein [Denitromonas halophila]|uniref:dTDP-4-dehydrorhamnose 3,5-epimerase n=1 Tax=Denitromonas halophila TaxID=1629404 RepID=A0A557QZI2_9RHOO|nr:dTDP-4-dehydrorhamnose 3,5-epimerase family protein [Denitromonas halophila]TVO58276.1 dTDP-4-keto-6-deoxy-D-glucose epimerase [Denitromonas halophila]
MTGPDGRVANGRFLVEDTPLAGLKRVQRFPLEDARGALERLYCSSLFTACGIDAAIAQINRTRTYAAGTVRGLHFQHPPHAEVKFVQCLRGAVFDVAVDLRAGSPTFLQWHADVLSRDNLTGLLIPAGFAHGLQTLSDDTELLYLHTAAYTPEAEDGIDALDPQLAIDWPLPIAERSERDLALPHIHPDFTGLSA